MGKKFEGSHPSFVDVMEGYQRLGLEPILGAPGSNTAFGPKLVGLADNMEFHTIPGSFTPDEVLSLLKDAGFGL